MKQGMTKRVVVIGAGPAGMMAAIKAAEQGADVMLLERKEQVGRKLAITGKGRSNFTNVASIPDIIKNMVGGGAFLNSSLRRFTNDDVRQFFAANGVPSKVERGGRVFPVSDRASDVVAAMVGRLRELRVDLRLGVRVRGLSIQDGRVWGVRLETPEKLTKEISAAAVIVATGGMSYPATGSTGDGYAWAKLAGHTVTAIHPALVPLETEEDWPSAAQGLALRNVKCALIIDGKKYRELFGELLFTHFGVSGPLVLTLSREAAVAITEKKTVELAINLKPALTMEQLSARIQRDLAANNRQQMKNALRDLLPQKLIAPVLDLAFIPEDKPASSLTAKERRRLLETICRLTLVITKPRPLNEAIVTAGGVSTREINPKTMESKIVAGLYFAGEVIDIDGLTGGYNLQAAFSTGAAAGTYAGNQASDGAE